MFQGRTQLIHEKNYTAIAISDITERANTGRSTFYRYFQTKADLLVSLHEDIFNGCGNSR
ncbi:MAG: helix-turn-helix transcriptional regulator [Anaerolineales bacterium]|nr:helix-turn-helix transcriptional regulator [Anaerolineales bacterium]